MVDTEKRLAEADATADKDFAAYRATVADATDRALWQRAEAEWKSYKKITAGVPAR